MKSKNSRKIIVHILLLLGITITVFPFVWMILTSFTPEAGLRHPL